MNAISTTNKCFVIALAGPSGSGKSTIAKRLAPRLNAQVISMETYTANSSLPLAERAKLNYDEPGALDVVLLTQHIRAYASGNDIESPIYDFAEHRRLSRSEHVPAKPVLIVEGILALHFSELRPYYDMSIYLDAPDDVCFRRRQVRDITERQRPLELIRWQYENTVLPATRRYVIPSKSYANAVVQTIGDEAAVEGMVWNTIKERTV